MFPGRKLWSILPFVPQKRFIRILSVKCFRPRTCFLAESRLILLFFFLSPSPRRPFEKLDLDGWKVSPYLSEGKKQPNFNQTARNPFRFRKPTDKVICVVEGPRRAPRAIYLGGEKILPVVFNV